MQASPGLALIVLTVVPTPFLLPVMVGLATANLMAGN